MSYQVLARKWRPGSFREMVGQEHVLQALVNALDHDRLHHAYLFTGTRGVGKTTIARILAKCLNCERGVSSLPCGECSSCQEIAEGRSVDLLEVDAASRTKVEDTRELLENVQYAPTRSRYKVYLIDEVHMLSSHSFNALLKTLEEPPPHVKFLLATTDPQKLPATILSRCLQFNLKNMPPEQIVGHLGNVLEQEVITFEEPALWLLGRAAAGSMRDALSLTDQAIAFGSGKVLEADVRTMLGSVDLSFVYQLLQAISAGEPKPLLDVVAHMAEHAPDFESSLNELISLVHRVAIAQAVPDAIDNSWGDAERVRGLAQSITAEDAQLFYQVALNGKRDIGLAPDPKSGFEMILLRMLAFRPLAVIDDTLESSGLLEAAQAEPQPAVGEVGDTGKKFGDAAPAPAEPEPEHQPPASCAAADASELIASVETPVLTAPRDLADTMAALSAERPEPTPLADAGAQPVPPAAPACDRPPDQGAQVGRSGNSDMEPTGPVALDVLEQAQWPLLLEQLGLAGIVYNIASHCELRNRDNDTLQFVLDEDNASLFNDSHSDKIRRALENYYQHSLSVSITPGQVQGETPAMRHARRMQERQAEAVAAIEGDTRLQELIVRFDGELDKSSIIPTDQ